MKIVRFITNVSRKIMKPPPIMIPTTPPLIQSPAPRLAEDEQPQASSSTAPPLPQNSRLTPVKRALLIGIQNIPPEKVPPSAKIAKKAAKKARRLSQRVANKLKAQHARENSIESSTLLGCHRDVKAMKQVLIELYGYKEEDIEVLIDGENPGGLLPTAENILNKLDEFVADAQPGDTFFFHFSGHSTQEATDDEDEEDGMNEFIVTYDNQKIQDNVLKEKLVDRLPVGSRLTAVFDTCHSASMLDLKHCRCNRVYVPWVNKGKRGSVTLWNGVVRQDAIPLSPVVTDQWQFPNSRYGRARGSSISQRLEASLPQSTAGSGHARPAVKRQSKVIPSASDGVHAPVPVKPLSAIPRDKTLSLQTDGVWFGSFGGESSPMARCASPMELFCQGWCKPEPNHQTKYPVVISLSAAKDGQRAWEDANGSSMTQTLVKILRTFHSRENPSPSLHDLLMDISHELHRKYLDIHAKSRDYKKQMRNYNLMRIARGAKASEPDPVEMDNFQDPQASLRSFVSKRNWLMYKHQLPRYPVFIL